MCVMILLSALSLTVGAAGGDDGMLSAERVGVPIRATSYGNSHGVLATSPEGREDMFYIGTYSNTGGQLVGYHSAGGELVTVDLPAQGCYGLCDGPDQRLYLGGVQPGNMYRFNPASGELEDLGDAGSGSTWCWDCDWSREGTVYGACYPHCNVLAYDIGAGQMRDLGPLHSDRQYVRSLCVDADDRVWAGVGMPPALWVIDPETDDRRQVLPEQFADDSSCYDLQRSGRYVCASVLMDGGLLVYDAETEEIVRHVAPEGDTIWWMLCAGAPPGEQYLYTFPDGHLYHYDIERDELTLLVEGLGQCEQVARGRYVHAIDDQQYVLYDLQEGRELDRRVLTEARDGMTITTLVATEDGPLFGSTYINQHMFGHRPGSGVFHDLGKVVRVGGQVDSMHAGRDGRVYMGSYVRATLSIYDPSRPWQPGRSADSNPRELGEVGYGQYRTQAIVLGPDDRIWVGSIPSYNSGPTGAFSVWDPETGEHRSWLDLVPGGAVNRIAVDERHLYCGGGGHFFVWDPVAEEKLLDVEMPVGAIAVADDGTVLVSSGDEIRRFDPGGMEFTGASASPIGAMHSMATGPDGTVYGLNDAAAVAIDPETLEATQISDTGGRLLAVAADGTVYFTRGPQLWRLQ